MDEELDVSKKSPADPARFSASRAALFATAVALFLIVFRPFDISIDSLAELLVLAGVAPLNFFAMYGIHQMSIAGGPLRTVAHVFFLVIVNSIYLLFWTGAGATFNVVVQVVLVVGLVMLGIGFWTRERTRYQAAADAAVHDPVSQPVVLRGQNDREILRLAPDALLYLSASGNYVDVHYLQNGKSAKSMLRASLAGLASQLRGVAVQQCHRSYLVNVAAIQRILSKRGRIEIELCDGLRIPVSRTFKQAVLAAVSD